MFTLLDGIILLGVGIAFGMEIALLIVMIDKEK